jgi:hypothetical protein
VIERGVVDEDVETPVLLERRRYDPGRRLGLGQICGEGPDPLGFGGEARTAPVVAAGGKDGRPAPESRRTVSAPIPEVPPVTIATRPANDISPPWPAPPRTPRAR